jgi:hypothetical protein
MEPLLDELWYDGPQAFKRAKLAAIPDLFERRAALFYTPTAQIPVQFIGSGTLEARLPIPFPNLFALQEIRGYQSPRMWVDLIQRATGKLRWTPIIPAFVTLILYDSWFCNDVNTLPGAKALIDALKATTTGRSDRKLLHYFGAIQDDDRKSLASLQIIRRRIKKPCLARCNVIVKQA